MSSQDKPFFRADHVGSLLRPDSVKRAREAVRQGTLGADRLRAIEDEAVAAMTRRQAGIGLMAATDGEVRRQNWWIDFIRAIPGIAIEQPVAADSFAPGAAGAPAYVPLNVAVRDRIEWRAPVMLDDFRALARLSPVMPKLTIPSPSRIHFHAGDAVAVPGVYPDVDAFWDDVARFYRSEIRALEAAGCRYIQIDDPVMSYFVDDGHIARMKARGMEPESTLARYVEVVNACVAGRDPSTYLTLHICRGNARSTWAASGGYAKIARTVFPAIDVDALFLEYDDDRSGDFAPLAHVGRQKVVLGLLTSKRPTLEAPAQVMARIEEAARVIPLDRLGLSPQCGFASSEEGNLVTEDDQWRKLALCVDIARQVWGGVAA